MSKPTLADYHAHLFGRAYMSGIDRDQLRIKATGEVFTPKKLVDKMLNQLDERLFSDPTKTFLDPACGDGEFLAGVLYRKLQNGIELVQALNTIYGIDIMPDNVELCQKRLLCGRTEKEVIAIVNERIIQRDSLKYFRGTDDKNQYEMNLPPTTKAKQ